MRRMAGIGWAFAWGAALWMGLPAAAIAAPTSTLYFSFTGDQAGDEAGRAVAITGDLNADGTKDVMFGAPLYNDGSSNDAGRVRIRRGSTGANIQTHTGDQPFGELGAAVSGTGDVNADGEPDVIVGIPFASGSTLASGVVRIYSKSTGTVIYEIQGEDTLDEFGGAVRGGYEATGDARSEAVIGAPGHDGAAGVDSGKAYVVLGNLGVRLALGEGEGAGDRFGEAVGVVGDVNLDGREDVVIGAPLHDGPAGADSGKVYVVDGLNGTLIWAFDGVAAGDEFGAAVAGAGDVDGDARADILVGAPKFDGAAGADSGAAYVFSGATGALIRSHEGETAGDEFGGSVAGVGDPLTDARAEYAAGAPLFDGTAGADSGKVYLFNGADGALAREYNGEVAGDLFGDAIGGGGDTNGDGKGDLVIGAPGFDDGAKASAGKVYLYGIAPQVPPPTCNIASTSPGTSDATRLALLALPIVAMLVARRRARRDEVG